MARKKNSKFVGSCGIYVFVKDNGRPPRLLVHRRSRQVSEPETIAAPGGIVERHLCGQDGLDFDAGARTTAVRELLEETGVELEADTVLAALPVGEGTYWGPEMHRNYYAELPYVPAVTGPERASLHELVLGGMDGIGEPAGDGYHAWVDVEELLLRKDLMLGCQMPLKCYCDNYKAELASSRVPVGAAGGPLKARGSIAKMRAAPY